MSRPHQPSIEVRHSAYEMDPEPSAARVKAGLTNFLVQDMDDLISVGPKKERLKGFLLRRYKGQPYHLTKPTKLKETRLLDRSLRGHTDIHKHHLAPEISVMVSLPCFLCSTKPDQLGRNGSFPSHTQTLRSGGSALLWRRI